MKRTACQICDDSMGYAGDYCPACALPDRPHEPHAATAWSVWLAAAVAVAALLLLR